MPDPRFFKATSPKTLAELAAMVDGKLADGAAAEKIIENVAPLDLATPSDLSFLDNVRYKTAFQATSAGACVVAPELAQLAPAGTALILSKSPYKAYALIAQAFYPQTRPEPILSERAFIHPDARIGEGCTVREGASIGQGAQIGRNTVICANAVIGENVVIGDECVIGSNAVISHSLIGSHVHVYPGCCIGQDGFGFAIDPQGHVKVPQLGRVIIEDHVEIGANTAIDRGAGPDTVIGQGSWIDNLVQIGHNVKIGKGCVIVAQVGISGSTVIEDYAVLAGQVGVAGHLRVGKGARVAAQSGLMRDVEPGAEVMGSPALPIKQHLRQTALLNRMIRDKSNKKK